VPARRPIKPVYGKKFVARVPKAVYAQLTARAKAGAVRLNALVHTYVAQGLGRKEAQQGGPGP